MTIISFLHSFNKEKFSCSSFNNKKKIFFFVKILFFFRKTYLNSEIEISLLAKSACLFLNNSKQVLLSTFQPNIKIYKKKIFFNIKNIISFSNLDIISLYNKQIQNEVRQRNLKNIRLAYFLYIKKTTILCAKVLALKFKYKNVAPVFKHFGKKIKASFSGISFYNSVASFKKGQKSLLVY
jgi:hypothetical protein